ncbi:MAG: sterol desaturase family protein [Burkholderiaceae bacterium]
MNLGLTILALAFPFIVLASLIEAVVLSRRQGMAAYDWRAAAVSLFDALVRNLLRLVPLPFLGAAFAWAYEHRVATIELEAVWAFVLLFFGQEFCYYWYHRAAHRVRWFWATHAVHHSPNQLNLSAAYRLGWTGKITGTLVFFLPLAWLGFDPGVVVATLAANLLYQFWIHATWIPRLGWLEYVLNTPSAHRVHHASNLEYLDANYGGVLIIFDRLFGTYVPERDDTPCVYGWVRPIRSYNPLAIEFTTWASLARDLLSARSLREVGGYLFGPPGWRPDGAGETTEALRAAAGLATTPSVTATAVNTQTAPQSRA